MFITELQPLVKEFFQQPLAFAGGFASGIFHLKLTDDPLKSWLEKQGAINFTPRDLTSQDNRPQSITID